MLALWLLGVGAWLAPRLGLAQVLTADGGLSLLGGCVIAGYVVVFLTRGPEDGDLDQALIRRIFAVGPLIFLLSPLALLVNALRSAARRRRAQERGQPHPDPASDWPGPPLSLPVRRTLALPAVVLGENASRQFLITELDLWGVLTRAADGTQHFARPEMAPFAVACLLVGFGTMVMGPRVVAGASLDWRLWLPRFLLYLAGAAFANSAFAA